MTTEDVVETLLGMEIVDEMDKLQHMQVLTRQQWAKQAKALVLYTTVDVSQLRK